MAFMQCRTQTVHFNVIPLTPYCATRDMSQTLYVRSAFANNNSCILAGQEYPTLHMQALTMSFIDTPPQLHHCDLHLRCCRPFGVSFLGFLDPFLLVDTGC